MMKEDFPEDMGFQLDRKIQEGLRRIDRQSQVILGKQRAQVGKVEVVPGGSLWFLLQEQRVSAVEKDEARTVKSNVLWTGVMLCLHPVALGTGWRAWVMTSRIFQENHYDDFMLCPFI